MLLLTVDTSWTLYQGMYVTIDCGYQVDLISIYIYMLLLTVATRWTLYQGMYVTIDCCNVCWQGQY